MISYETKKKKKNRRGQRILNNMVSEKYPRDWRAARLDGEVSGKGGNERLTLCQLHSRSHG